MRRLTTMFLAGLLCAGFAWPEQQDGEPRVREVFSGAGMIYSMPEVTLVYPAEPASERQRNLISTERRAAFLTGRYGIETQVVADVDVTDEQRDDNLLVLGWSNSLLRECGEVQVGPSGWKFQGLEHGFDRDLLLAWVSPWDPERLFAFWSRIDPELDRYLVLPFFGSDYIVFDRYFIERYGRFERDEIAWPPRRNRDVMVDNAQRRYRPGVRGQSEHYLLLDASLLTEEEADAVLAAREAAWAAATAALGSPEKPRRIELFVYKNSEQKDELTFVHDARHHMPSTGELHLTRVIALDPNAHEDSHLVARQLFGPGYLTVLVEGVAVWVEQQQSGNDLPVYANLLVDAGDLPRVADLFDEETMRVLMRTRRGFPLAGLFVDWLQREFGVDGIRRLYGFYASDIGPVAEALGLSVEELESGFRAYVERQAEAGATETAFRAARAKARQLDDLGDFERAAPAYLEALEIRPDHLPTRYRLAQLYTELDDPERAEAQLRHILEAPAEARSAAETAVAWFDLGRSLAARGDREEARKALEKVLEIPDQGGTHARARELLEGTR